MFTSRYFNPRYWASRYWVKTGGAPVALPRFCEITSNNISPTLTSNNETVIRSNLCR